MNPKFPLTDIGILNPDTCKWYEAEQCWNCEPEELRKMQIKKSKPTKTRRKKQL